MNPKVRAMLEKVYGLIDERFRDSRQSWDHFVEFLAVTNSAWLYRDLHNKLGWLFENPTLTEQLAQAYDSKLLTSDYYDHLGEMYLEKIVSPREAKRKGQFLTPQEVAGLLAQMTITETNKPINVLDPAVGSGRLLMAAHQIVPKAQLFGVDRDLYMIRMALTNFAIHNIPGYLLHANGLEHEIDIAAQAGRENWRYANRWDSAMDKLRPASRDSQIELTLTQNQKRQTED
ncbi:MAG: N-6 DNA methylase [Proteobacteria bacterium]|nr:N-6 DNA methylase [Pseudomonadota bacterium]